MDNLSHIPIGGVHLWGGVGMAKHQSERTDYAFRKLMMQVVVSSSRKSANLAWLTDISSKECYLEFRDTCISISEFIDIDITNEISLSGNVMSMSDGKIHVSFHYAIPPEKFQSIFEQAHGVPIAPGSGFFDNFGRKLPKLIRSTR